MNHAALARVMRELDTTPWLLPAAHHTSLRSRLHELRSVSSAGSSRMDYADLLKRMESSVPRPRMEGSTMIIPVKGVLLQGADALEQYLLAAADPMQIAQWVANAMSDKKVQSVLLDVNSPGGGVGGIPELASAITALAATKPVAAWCVQCCSAGLYAVSGAGAIHTSQSGELGSVGVYAALLDTSAAYEMQGVKTEMFVSAGADLKGAGHPGLALTDAQRSDLQAQVDSLASDFQAHLLATRPRINAEQVFRGGVARGRAAYASGLADHHLSSPGLALASAPLTPLRNLTPITTP